MNTQFISYMIIWFSVKFIRIEKKGNLYDKSEQVLHPTSHLNSLMLKNSPEGVARYTHTFDSISFQLRGLFERELLIML